MSAIYQVYWAPGCTSCLRTKEFLLQHDLDFESINIVEQPEALEDLARVGFRSVPVVRRGDEAVFCQDLQDVADFVGLPLVATELSAPDFISRLDHILLAAQRYAKQLSEEQLAGHFPGRERPYRDLVCHIFMVVEGFLEAAEGGSLENEVFYRTPPEGITRGEELAAIGEQVRRTLLAWWEGITGDLPATVQTYYGERTAVSVLERTTWHAAQHCRQLQAVVEGYGMAPDGPLGDTELAGLPLPANIYDNEIDLEGDSPGS